MTDRDLLDEQIAYYRARAAEYDATSTPEGDPYAAHGAATHAALREFGPRGRVLELAAGTGQWSRRLAEVADELVVSDSSPEMLQLARARVGDLPHVVYEQRDAFDLEPTHDFDVVMFGYFLSHVPPDRFEAFWSALDGVLRSDGRVFFVDEGRHFLWREDWIDEPAGIVRRQLGDGTVHRAVKVLWATSELESRLRSLGWTASVDAAGPFYWGSASR